MGNVLETCQRSNTLDYPQKIGRKSPEKKKRLLNEAADGEAECWLL